MVNNGLSYGLPSEPRTMTDSKIEVEAEVSASVPAIAASYRLVRGWALSLHRRREVCSLGGVDTVLEAAQNPLTIAQEATNA